MVEVDVVLVDANICCVITVHPDGGSYGKSLGDNFPSSGPNDVTFLMCL